MRATRKVTMNLHVVPKVYNGFFNMEIGNVKSITQYNFTNVDDVTLTQQFDCTQVGCRGSGELVSILVTRRRLFTWNTTVLKFLEPAKIMF